MSQLDYLRHRPFLVIEYYTRPNGTAPTERKGWMDYGASKHDHPSIAYRISNNTMRRAAVIIDLFNNSVIKNRPQTMMADDEVLAYYKAKYPEMVGSAMGIYA